MSNSKTNELNKIEASSNISNNKSDLDSLDIKLNSKLDNSTQLITTTSEVTQKWLDTAMYNFNNNYHQYSAYLKESSIGNTLIEEAELNNLAINTQSDMLKVKRINDIARYYTNRDDLIGKVYETIESNVNTEYKLSYKDNKDNASKGKILNKVKEVIDDFNEQINLKGLLRKCVPLTYLEGNYPMYLKSNNGNYKVDYYPLGVVDVSDYDLDGEPYLIINVKELESRLLKVNKTNKNGTSLFFKDISEEIKNNYPTEVYNAHIAKERYVKLNIEKSGILRINNMNRKYGVTPIFRTFKPASILETFEQTDKINAKSKGKKIILQTLRKELMGVDYEKQSFEEMAYAHDSLMKAWRNDIVVYTPAAFVESVAYVEPKVESIDINSVYYYRSKILTNLGISFLDSNNKGAYATANISVKELMKMINKITEQLEEVIKKWYKVVLKENNIDISYCPSIKIIDSEMLEAEMKLKMVEVLYSKMNCSLETAYDLMGVDIEEEAMRRKSENTKKYDEIFTPRMTAYTNSGETTKTTTETQKGRPIGNSKNESKTKQDQNRRGTL